MRDPALPDTNQDQNLNDDLSSHLDVVRAKDEDPRKPANGFDGSPKLSADSSKPDNDSSTASLKIDRSANEHHGPPSANRNPDDEKPADWNSYVKGVQMEKPYRIRDIVPGAKCPTPPGRITFDRNGPVPQETAPPLKEALDPKNEEAVKANRGVHASDRYVGGTPRATNPNAPNLEKGGDPPVVMNDHKLAVRQHRWDAYRTASMQVDGVQRSLAPNVDQFFQAENNPELADLGFIMPKGYKGSLDNLAEKQEVPNRGGQAVGGLFRAGGALNTTKKDDHAFASAAQNAQKHGGADNKFEQTHEADKNLSAAINHARGGQSDLVAASNRVTAAVKEIELNEATEQAGEAREEIEALARGREAGLSVVEFVINGPAKVLSLAAPAEHGGEEAGPGAALESIGAFGSMLINAIPSTELTAAKAKLATALANMKSTKKAGLEATLWAAMNDLHGKLDHLSADRDRVSAMLSARRTKYNEAGAASGALADGDQTSKAKVSATISAIPIVEGVVGALRAIIEKSNDARPKYSDEGGIGYGMALYHGTEAAWELPNAIGAIEFSHDSFEGILAEWSTRLKSLMAKRDDIAGVAPGG